MSVISHKHENYTYGVSSTYSKTFVYVDVYQRTVRKLENAQASPDMQTTVNCIL